MNKAILDYHIGDCLKLKGCSYACRLQIKGFTEIYVITEPITGGINRFGHILPADKYTKETYMKEGRNKIKYASLKFYNKIPFSKVFDKEVK